MADRYAEEIHRLRNLVESGASAEEIGAGFDRVNAVRDLYAARQRFIEAAQQLDREWSRAERVTGAALLNEGYPEYLPDFEMFVSELIDWRDTEKP